MDTVKNLFNMEQFNLDHQKFDVLAFLKTASAATAASANNAMSPPSTPQPNNNNNNNNNNNSVTPSTTTTSPQQLSNFLATNLMNPITRIALNNISPFVPIKPVYAPSGYGRQILIYDSRSYPGHRREFAYKTRFTNQSGLTTVYYRCMACRALRHKMQRVCEKEKLPAVPCIAVKNELLINDPDFPEASDHFCQPLTIEASNDKLKISFERGFKRSRMKQAAEESANKKTIPMATCEIDESSTNPIDQYFWTKTESAACLLINDETAQSSSSFTSKSSEASKDNVGDSTTIELKQEAKEEPTDSDTEMMDIKTTSSRSTPRKSLDELLRLHDKRLNSRECEREKSTSPDENLNIQNFAQKMFESVGVVGHQQQSTTTTAATTNLLLNQLGLSNNNNGLNSSLNGFTNSSMPFLTAQANSAQTSDFSNINSTNSSLLNFQALANRLKGSELLKVLSKPTSTTTISKNNNTQQQNFNSAFSNQFLQNNSITATFNAPEPTHMNEILNKYIWNSWDLPENAGNSRSAAELTCSLIMSLARNIPQAAASIKQGKWARKEFMGEEVYGKTLAIIGLGRIGFEVASRMQAFGMKTVGFDPLVSNEEAAKRQIKWMSLEEIWPIADYITVHVPLIAQTKNLLNKQTFNNCKKGVKIINAARGGIINELDLIEAINSGHVSGAAIDVFVEEPPTYNALTEHPKIICTPHLGASTLEAQQRVAVEIAENIISLNNGSGIFGAINANALAAIVDETKAQYVKTVSALGQILASIAPNTKNVILKHPAGANGLQRALIAGSVLGLLQASNLAGLNLVNAEVNAIKEGITVKTEQIAGNELILTNGSTQITGYPSPAGPIISAINGSKVPVPIVAAGTMAISKNPTNLAVINEKLKSKVSVEYGLIGGGRLALFGALEQDEINQLSENFSIIHFESSQ